MQRARKFSKDSNIKCNIEPASSHIQPIRQKFLVPFTRICLLSGALLATDLSNTHLYILISPSFFCKVKTSKTMQTLYT